MVFEASVGYRKSLTGLWEENTPEKSPTLLFIIRKICKFLIVDFGRVDDLGSHNR